MSTGGRQGIYASWWQGWKSEGGVNRERAFMVVFLMVETVNKKSLSRGAQQNTHFNFSTEVVECTTSIFQKARNEQPKESCSAMCTKMSFLC